MTDVEDLVEAIFDIEDIVEEVADPEDLIEDLIANPLMILFAFIAALSALFLFVLFLITLILLVLAFGPVEVVVLLMLLNLVVLAASILAFLHVRTSIPSDVYDKINTALEQADDSSEQGGPMTEKEAIEELKHQYSVGNLDDYELDQALDDALTSDNPEAVVEQYTEATREEEYERG